MTINELVLAAPSAFAESPAPHVSSRYLFIPSRDIITQLYSRGWEAVRSYDRPRSTHRHGQHVIRFRLPSPEPVAVGDILPELVLYNSSDGSSTFELPVGLFRVWCKNGATAPVPGQVERIRKIHVQNHREFDLHSEIDRAIATVPQVLDKVHLMQAKRLGHGMQRELVKRFLPHAYDEVTATHATPEAWLLPQREADHENDLWTTFSVVQEYFERGGVQLPWGRTRGVREPHRLHFGNLALWKIAEEALTWN